jgi:SH3-like domain-containing protein
MRRILYITSAILCGFSALTIASAVPLKIESKRSWGSLNSGHILVRTGPGRNFPATWDYRQASLPVIITQKYENWCKITDPDAASGWLQCSLISSTRTGLVIGGVRPLRSAPDESAKLLWRVEPGVVGKISECSAGWCRFETGGKAGYIVSRGLWGVE